ncbi:MAG: VWA domain-containing protein [Acidobacteriota bacterium]
MTSAAELPKPMLDGYYDRWLASVSQLIAPQERQAFEALTDDLERELFIRRFWQARQATAGDTSIGLVRWQQNYEEARHRFEDMEEDRAQVLMMAGKPARVVVFAECASIVRPLRIWSYGSWNGQQRADSEGESFYLVFYRESEDGPFHFWSPAEGPSSLLFSGPARSRDWSVDEIIDLAVGKRCFRWNRHESKIFAAALRNASGHETVRQAAPPAPPSLAWLDELAAELRDDSGLPGRLQEITFPGRYQRKTVVRGRVRIPASEIQRNAEGLLFDRIVISGDVRLGQRTIDTFRVVHLIAGSQPEGADVALDFYRRLRPADYTLSLRVETASGLGLVRERRQLTVPFAENEAEAPAGYRLGLPGLTRSEVGVLTTFPSIELLPVAEQLLVGDVDIAAVTTGGPIERVEFRLDGASVGRDAEPPYAATLPLGRTPRQASLEAIAYDPEGREIARDTVVLNTGSARFAVRLVEPQRGSLGRRARVEVDVPRDEVLERVDLYLDQRHLVTLHEPPFDHTLPVTTPGATTYVRAVATLASGASAEDLVFLQSRQPVDEIDVQLVELFTSVYDNHGRFATGLTEEDFTVLEDGVPQQIRRFDTVENLAINVALLMDVSASMRQKMWIATRSAQRFFDTVLTPKDRASLMTFNHDIRQVVPFTNGVADLRYGVDGFRAWGTTRLNDSVVYTVHSFGGLEGKRALVLLSDGQDVDSDFQFKQVLEYTLRAGVAAYPIALGVEDPLTAQQLRRLAADSGGRFFQIAGVRELDGIYRQIEEELRSQYLLVYEPPPKTQRHEFRRVEIKVSRDGLRARSIHGYYP